MWIPGINGCIRCAGNLALILITTLALSQTATAQELDELLGPTELLTLEAISVQPCIVHLPLDYDPDQTYPLVLGLHGYGSNIDRFHTNWYAFDDPQFIYACPQAPYPTIQSFGLGFGWFLSGTGDAMLELQTIGLTHDYALETIELLRDQYNIGEIFLLGFSQGAMLSLLVAMENPDLVAGVGFLSSRIDPWLENAGMLEGLADTTRVFATHGTTDDDVKSEDGRRARDMMIDAGLDVTWLEFEGGHTILTDTLREFQSWMN